MDRPLTDQQLDEITAKAAELRARLDRKNPWPCDNEAYWQTTGWRAGTRNALDKLHTEALVAEVRRLRTELAAARTAAFQEAAEIAEGLRQFERTTGPRAAAQVSENVGILRVADELRARAAATPVVPRP